MHRRLLLLLVALTLGITACGSDEERLSEEEFQKEANTICSAASDRATELGEELGEELGDGEEPTEAQLKETFGKVLDSYDGLIADIEDLDEPEDLESDVKDALDEARTTVDDVREQLNDDPNELLSSEEDPFASVNEKFNDLGLEECGDEES
jgi:F0F1-type ATP synthase membrane subunit b/b'